MQHYHHPKSPLSEILSSYFESKDEHLHTFPYEKVQEEMKNAEVAFDSVLEAEKMIQKVYQEIRQKVSSS